MGIPLQKAKDPAPRPDNPIIKTLNCDRLGLRHYPLSATSKELPAHFFRVCSLSNLSQYRFSCCPSLLIPSARFGYFFPCLRRPKLLHENIPFSSSSLLHHPFLCPISVSVASLYRQNDHLQGELLIPCGCLSRSHDRGRCHPAILLRDSG